MMTSSQMADVQQLPFLSRVSVVLHVSASLSKCYGLPTSQNAWLFRDLYKGEYFRLKLCFWKAG